MRRPAVLADASAGTVVADQKEVQAIEAMITTAAFRHSFADGVSDRTGRAASWHVVAESERRPRGR